MSMSYQIVQQLLEVEDVNSVPFPSNRHAQPHGSRRPSTTPSSSSASNLSGYGPYHLRTPSQSVSGRTAKRLSLSPVAEEWEHGFHQTRGTPSNHHRRPQQQTIGRGQSGLLAEEITMAMMMIPPTTGSTRLAPSTRKSQGFRSSARRRMQSFMSFIRRRMSQPHHPRNR